MGNVVVRRMLYLEPDPNVVEVHNLVAWSNSYAANGDTIQTTASAGLQPDAQKIMPVQPVGDLTRLRSATFEQVGLFATGVLTSTGTNVSAGDTVTIGSMKYRFASSLTSADLVTGYDVLIGANAAASIANLKAAINGESGYGSTFHGLTPRNDMAEVIATNGSTTLTFRAIHLGTKGNSVPTTETAAQLSFGGATLASGADWVDRTAVLKKSSALAQLIVTSTGADDTAAADRSLYGARLVSVFHDSDIWLGM